MDGRGHGEERRPQTSSAAGTCLQEGIPSILASHHRSPNRGGRDGRVPDQVDATT